MAKRRGRHRRGPINEMNMTPFIDVMLVLLVIFMVTAPLMSGGVSLDLPKANSNPVQLDKNPVTVSINAQGQVFINKLAVSDDEFSEKLLEASPKGVEELIVFKGDKTIPYERVTTIITAINKAGFKRLSLLSEQSK